MNEFCKHGNLKGNGNCRECNPEIRSNKMKLCKNKDCYNYNELQKYNCNIWRLVTNCHVYLDKPKISARTGMKLKKCPFCGYDVKLIEGVDEKTNPSTYYYIRCTNCWFESEYGDNKNNLINWFNTRTGEK